MDGSFRDRGRERQGRRFSILGEMRRAGGEEQGPHGGRSKARGRKSSKRQSAKDKGSSRRRHNACRGGGKQSRRRDGKRNVPPHAGVRQSDAVRSENRGMPGPFELFMAYHLGIGADGRYKATNIHEVARRFHTSAAGIRELLAEYGMDSDAVINSSFDMAMAQYDIQVAPDGVNVVELAKNLYEEFKAASRNTRNWEEELARDAAANAEIFGKKQ